MCQATAWAIWVQHTQRARPPLFQEGPVRCAVIGGESDVSQIGRHGGGTPFHYRKGQCWITTPDHLASRPRPLSPSRHADGRL
jgi:hypothetical protein